MKRGVSKHYDKSEVFNEVIDSINPILQHIKAVRTKEAVALIEQTSVQELNSIFENKLKEKTTLLCEASLMKSIEVVRALLEKNVDVNINISNKKYSHETIIKRMIWAENFDEQAVPIGKLLIQHGAEFFLEDCYIKTSILSAFHDDFLSLDDRKICLIGIEKYKTLMSMMGNEFYDNLLYLPRSEFSTPLCLFERAVKKVSAYGELCELYNFVLDSTLSYFDSQENITNETLVRLLISSDFNDNVINFVKKKLLENVQDTNIEQQEKRDAVLIQTNYDSLDRILMQISLFNYDNEKEGFRYGLSQPLLSYDVIFNIHKKSLQKGEEPWIADGVQASLGDLGYECSINGFLELRECHRQKGWFNLEKVGFRSYMMIIPQATDKQNLISLLEEYNHDMSKINSRIEKLKKIIKLSSDLSRMHYFMDANKRTFFIVLNCELLKHGFLPTMMKDRMALRGSSQDEIFIKVLEGMEKCLNKLTEISQASSNKNIQSKELFSVSQKRKLSADLIPGSVKLDKSREAIKPLAEPAKYKGAAKTGEVDGSIPMPLITPYRNLRRKRQTETVVPLRWSKRIAAKQKDSSKGFVAKRGCYKVV